MRFRNLAMGLGSMVALIFISQSALAESYTLKVKWDSTKKEFRQNGMDLRAKLKQRRPEVKAYQVQSVVLSFTARANDPDLIQEAYLDGIGKMGSGKSPEKTTRFAWTENLNQDSPLLITAAPPSPGVFRAIVKINITNADVVRPDNPVRPVNPPQQARTLKGKLGWTHQLIYSHPGRLSANKSYSGAKTTAYLDGDDLEKTLAANVPRDDVGSYDRMEVNLSLYNSGGGSDRIFVNEARFEPENRRAMRRATRRMLRKFDQSNGYYPSPFCSPYDEISILGLCNSIIYPNRVGNGRDFRSLVKADLGTIRSGSLKLGLHQLGNERDNADRSVKLEVFGVREAPNGLVARTLNISNTERKVFTNIGLDAHLIHGVKITALQGNLVMPWVGIKLQGGDGRPLLLEGMSSVLNEGESRWIWLDEAQTINDFYLMINANAEMGTTHGVFKIETLRAGY